MSDTYTEITRTSWLSRIKNAISGIFFGFLLIVGGIILLFWNEGRTVKNKRALQEGEKVVMSVSAETIQQGNESKLIHFSGMAVTNDTLYDADFGISEVAICLERKVEMYQWEENEESTTEKKVGGSEETRTKYTYSKVWSSSLKNSSDFKVQKNHENPANFRYNSNSVYASGVSVGAFQLPEALIRRINGSQTLQLTNVQADVKDMNISNSMIYIGKGNISNPKIGDVKITYSVVKPQNVSIIGKQHENSVEPYTAKNGNSVYILKAGLMDAGEMFKEQLSSNNRWGWILRLVGFFLIFAGFGALFKVLSVIADVIPFIGNIVSFGTGIISCILAFAVSIVIIAAAWIYYRPVIGISLAAVALLSVVYIFVIGARKKRESAR